MSSEGKQSVISSRRRLQNRDAQRRFRERRAMGKAGEGSSGASSSSGSSQEHGQLFNVFSAYEGHTTSTQTHIYAQWSNEGEQAEVLPGAERQESQWYGWSGHQYRPDDGASSTFSPPPLYRSVSYNSSGLSTPLPNEDATELLGTPVDLAALEGFTFAASSLEQSGFQFPSASQWSGSQIAERATLHSSDGYELSPSALDNDCSYASSQARLALQGLEASPPLLHAAIRSRNRSIAATLLQRGAADVNDRDDMGRTALHIAAELDDAALVSLLLAYNADARLRDLQGQTALYVAVYGGHDHIVELMLDNANAAGLPTP